MGKPKHFGAWLVFCLSWAAMLPLPLLVGADLPKLDQRIQFSGSHSQSIELTAGQTIELSAGIVSPTQLPANGRVAAEWSGPAADCGFRKVLHALDPDVYLVYRAPQAGRYTLSLRAVEDEEPPAS